MHIESTRNKIKAGQPIRLYEPTLEPGERLIWRGKPNSTLYAWRQALITSVVSVSLGAPLGWIWAESLHPALSLLTFLLITVPGGIITATCRFNEAKQLAKTNDYYLTNRRVGIRYLETLKTHEGRLTTQEITLYKIDPRVCFGGGGINSIKLNLKEKDLIFRSIENAQEVCQLILAAKADLPTLPESNAYYTRSGASDSIEDRLRSCEQIIWRGQPMTSIKCKFKLKFAFIAILIIILMEIDLYCLGLVITVAGLTLVSLLALVVAAALFPIVSKVAIDRVEYFITSQRVIIAKWQRDRLILSARELWETTKLKIKVFRNGSGTIFLDRRTKLTWYGHGFIELVDEFAFYNVADATTVLMTIIDERTEQELEEIAAIAE